MNNRFSDTVKVHIAELIFLSAKKRKIEAYIIDVMKERKAILTEF